MNTTRRNPPRLRAMVERRLRADATERARMAINLTAMLFLPLTSFLLLELMVQGTPAVAPKLQGLNYVLYAGLLLLVTALCRNLRTGGRLYTVLIWCLATAEYVVLAYRSSPILPADLRSLGTAVNVASHYSFPFSWRYLAVTAAFVLQFIACRHLTWRWERPLRSVVAAALAVGMMAGVSAPVMHPWGRYKMGVNTSTHQPVQMAAENGFVLNFVHCLYEREVEEPESYSLERVEALADSYEQMLAAPEIDKIMRSAMLSTVRGYVSRPVSDSVIRGPAPHTFEAANTAEAPLTVEAANTAGRPHAVAAHDRKPEAAPEPPTFPADRHPVTGTRIPRTVPYPGPGALYIRDLMQAQHFGNDARDYLDFSYLDVPTEDPAAYHDAAVDRILRTLNRGSEKRLAPGVKPDIVVVMNESFSDLRRLTDYETNLEVLPVYEGLTANARKGDAHVSVIGGNTANSEFEFLTGASLAFLPTGTIAYQQYIETETPSLVSLLEAQGYHTAALHPYYSDGWERETVYPLLGFDEMKFIDDFVHRDTVRDYISDTSVYREIEDTLDRGEEAGTPSFVFAVTMQNHGAYGDVYDNFRDDVHLSDPEGTPALDQYLSLIRESDRMLGEFLLRLQKRERPTLLLLFGDHQPNDATVTPITDSDAYNALDPREQAGRRRITPYLLWTNYELEADKDAAETDADASDFSAPAHTSLNYLALDVLDAAHLKLCPWRAFLRDLRQDFPVIDDVFYYDTDGTPHLFSELEEGDMPAALQDYEILQYNYLFDLEHRVDRLFEPYR